MIDAALCGITMVAIHFVDAIGTPQSESFYLVRTIAMFFAAIPNLAVSYLFLNFSEIIEDKDKTKETILLNEDKK